MAGVSQYRERLIDFTIAQGIELEFKDSVAPGLGMRYGARLRPTGIERFPSELSERSKLGSLCHDRAIPFALRTAK